MLWILEIAILLVIAMVLRHILHMGPDTALKPSTPRFRRPANNPLCSPLVSEIEAHTAILGVLLNDAIDEQNGGNTEIASRILNVFGAERGRLVELVINLQNLSLKYLPTVQYPLDIRGLDSASFHSQPVSDLFRRHSGLEQFVFRSKLRFQLQLRLLRRATALLNEGFEVIKKRAETNGNSPDMALTQFDVYFHDLDLLAKETLVRFSAELACLPESVMEDMAVELSALTSHSPVASPIATLSPR